MKTINSTIKLINRYMIIIISYFVLSVSCVNAETSYFADNFENGLDKWVVAGDSWQLTDLFCRSSNHSISESPEGEYPPNANSTITMKIRQYSDLIDLSDSNDPILTFWHKIGIYSSDICLVEISEDNGFNWEALESFTDTWRSTWSREQIDLSGYKTFPIMIRFRLRANGDHQTWGWDIDDIEIKEKDPEIIPFPFSDDFENGLANWMLEEGDAWKQTAQFYRSPGYSISESSDIDYPADACSDLVLAHPIDLSLSESPVLVFWHKIGVYNSDYSLVEISEDNGFTWDTLISFTNTWRSTWSREQIDLSGYKTSPIMIRFRLRANGDHQTWGWDIDDVEIKEKDKETFAFPFFDDFENGLNKWILNIGDSWQPNDEDFVSHVYSIAESPYGNYPAYACSDLILAHPIDLSLSTFPVLTFWHRIGVYGSDYGYIDISEDGGNSWSSEPLACYTDTWLSTWSREQIDLSEYKTSPILIRFRLRANGDHESWGWDIDDIHIKELFYHPDPERLNVQITNIDNSTCPKIQASVIVTDENDEAVVGLDASNFTVYEDSILQTPITVELSTSIVCAGLALDYSGSMEPNALEALETAASDFVELMLPGDRGEIIKFAEGIEIMQEYTNDRDALLNAIQRDTTLDSSFTSFYDAIYQAISDTAEQTGNKAVIAMSDGRDNYSEHSATEVIDHALTEGVPVFTIGLGDEIDEDVLIAIATKTGGIYYYAPTPDDLVDIYQKIAGTLKTQYLVTYYTTICDPNSSGDVEHELSIEVNQDMAFGHGTKRFRCPVSCNSDAVLDTDIDNLIKESENKSGR